MKKISTVQAFGNEIFKEQKLTIGVDLGDRWSFYCVLDEAGKIILEQTTPKAMKAEVFEDTAKSHRTGDRNTLAMVSRLLTELGHQVILAHAQKVQLITKSNRKDDRHDARTPAPRSRHDFRPCVTHESAAPGLDIETKTGLRLKFHTAATLVFAAMNSRRSALIWSALVVGLPCGKPLYVFKMAPFTNFALSGPESA